VKLLAKLGLGLAGTVGGLGVIGVVAAPSSDPQQATVAKHVDGDTFDVNLNGSTERIRLLNIDTPETVDPNRPVQCLGAEASQFLADMLPVGSPVRLEFDKKHVDKFGRTLAAAFTPDGKMVNAEVARAGLAQVVTVDDNVRFRPPIEQAAQEATENKRGLHSADVQCTFPGRVAAVSNSVAQAPTLALQPPNADSHALYTATNLAFIAVGAARSLVYDLDHAGNDLYWSVLNAAEQAQLRSQAQANVDKVNAAQTELQNAANAAKAKEDLAAQQAAQAEADRVAREQAAAQEAEQQRVAAEAQRQAAAQAAEQQRAAAAAQRQAAAERQQEAAAQRAAAAPAAKSPSTSRHTGQTGHPCMSGERDGDHDGYCGEGR
jgi:micrococcal nuclease